MGFLCVFVLLFFVILFGWLLLFCLFVFEGGVSL